MTRMPLAAVVAVGLAVFCLSVASGDESYKYSQLAGNRQLLQEISPASLSIGALQEQNQEANQLLSNQNGIPSAANAPGASDLGDSEYALPVALFPLRTPGLQSVLGGYKGASNLASFTEDSTMNDTTLQCGIGPSAIYSKVTIPNVPFADEPSWAVIFWMKTNQTGAPPQPLFIYSALESQTSPDTYWAPNQIKVMLMGTSTSTVFGRDNQPGIIRAVVRDQYATYNGSRTITYLDSNGQTHNTSNTTSGGRVDDDQWHMITITSLGDGPGFAMYVDGAQAGILRTNATEEGQFGAQMNIDSSIHLCTDPNIDPYSYGGYTGRMLELSLWNVSFRPDDVSDFFLQHWANPANEDALAPQSLKADSRAPAISPDSESTFDSVLLSYLNSLPETIALFPLDGDLDSVLGEKSYSGSASNVTWSLLKPNGTDNSTALTCSKNNGSSVTLDAVEYGLNGAWAINLWFRPAPSGLVGTEFEYIFSQQNKDQTYPTGWEANQVRMYFPQINHPAFGILRAIVKDGSEIGSPFQSFLDSDGRIGGLNRPDSSNAAVRAGSALLQGGGWHMMTLTTLEGQDGYAMFVDADLAGVMNATTIQQSNFTEPDGGRPMNMTGNITLCARNESGTGAYDGQISQLAIFSSSLTSGQIAALFVAFQDDYEQAGQTSLAGAAAPMAEDRGLVDIYNDQCRTPLNYQDQPVNGCATFDVEPQTPVCYVADDSIPTGGAWSECAAGQEVSTPNITTLEGLFGDNARKTASQRECVLPNVLEDRILTDCFLDPGVMTQGCQMPTGLWDKCAANVSMRESNTPLAVPFLGQPGGFIVANRTTVTGKPCAFPYVLNDTMARDCRLIEDGSLGSCFTEDRQWEQCSPMQATANNATNSTRRVTTLLALAASRGRLPLGGGLGGFCIPDGFGMYTGRGRGFTCQSGLTCVLFPVGQRQVDVAITLSFGYCAQLDKGGDALFKAYRNVNNATLPAPDDFFPLTGSSNDDLRSITFPSLEGSSSGISWTEDDMFESALTCSRENGSVVQLESSTFSLLGQWAINLWFKKIPGSSDEGPQSEALGYIFSNTGVGNNASDNTDPNQVQIYLPTKNSPSVGIVRTIVKDNMDAPDPNIPTENRVYLDSDGQVNNVLDGPKNATDVNDGNWHMVTLSTNFRQFAGYRMFLDGELVAKLDGASTAVTFPSNLNDATASANSSGFRIGGGAPIVLDGPINLCGRSDNLTSRIFDGKLAHLALFNRFLSASQIRRLYQSYMSNYTASAPEPGLEPATEPAPAEVQVQMVPQAPPGAPPPSATDSSVNREFGSAGGDQGGQGSSTNVGAIVGGVVGGVVALLVVAGLAYYFTRGRSGRDLNASPSVLKPIFSANGKSGTLEMSASHNPYVRQLDDVGFGGRPDQASPPVNGDTWSNLATNGEARNQEAQYLSPTKSTINVAHT